MALGESAGLNNPRRTNVVIPCEVGTCFFNNGGVCSMPVLIKINKEHRCTNFTKRTPKKGKKEDKK